MDMQFVATLMTPISALVGVGIGAYIPAAFETKRSERELSHQNQVRKETNSQEQKSIQLARIQELMGQVTTDLTEVIEKYEANKEQTIPDFATTLEELADSVAARHREARRHFFGIWDKQILKLVETAYIDSGRWLHDTSDAFINEVPPPDNIPHPGEALDTVTWAVHGRIAELAL